MSIRNVIPPSLFQAPAFAPGLFVTIDVSISSDLGIILATADAQLGPAGGTIFVPSGNYSMSTPFAPSSYHTVQLAPNVTINNHCTKAAFQMRDHTTVCGTDWSSIITESDATGSWVVFQDYNSATTSYIQPGDVDGNTDWQVHDLQIIGANPAFNSAPSTIQIGNSHYVRIKRVFLNSTKSLGITIGGTWSFDSQKIDSALILNIKQ